MKMLLGNEQLVLAALLLLAVIVLVAVWESCEGLPFGADGRRFEIVQRNGLGRILLTSCFWLWGIFGGGSIAVGVFLEEQLNPLRVGIPFTVITQLTAWIGGMLLFGIGAMLAPSRAVMRLVDPDKPG